MKPKTRKQRLRELQSVANKGMNACVIELAENYLNEFPKSGIAWFIYFEALQNLSKYKEAKKALNKAIEFYINPEENLEWLYLQMGKLLEKTGKFREAIEWYEKALEKNSDEATFPIFLGLVYFHLGKYYESEKTLLQATVCKNGCIEEAFYNLGVLLIAQKRYEEASIYIEKALEIDPKYKEAKHVLKDMKKIIEIKIIEIKIK